MNKLIGIILVLAGAWMIYTGYKQASSVVGRTKTSIVELKNDFDGKNRMPKQYWYYGGGVLLVVAGGVIAVRRGK